MLTWLQEKIAPYDTDLERGEVDDRSFIRRLADDDMSRAENPGLLLGDLNGWHVDSCVTLLNWAFGVEFGHEPATNWTPGFTTLGLSLGPWHVTLIRLIDRKVF